MAEPEPRPEPGGGRKNEPHGKKKRPAWVYVAIGGGAFVLFYFYQKSKASSSAAQSAAAQLATATPVTSAGYIGGGGPIDLGGTLGGMGSTGPGVFQPTTGTAASTTGPTAGLAPGQTVGPGGVFTDPQHLPITGVDGFQYINFASGQAAAEAVNNGIQTYQEIAPGVFQPNAPGTTGSYAYMRLPSSTGSAA